MIRTRGALFRAAADRYGYDEWRGVNTLDEELLLWNFYLGGSELPGWQLHRAEEAAVPGWPRVVQSVWLRERGGAALVDVFECASRDEAQALLVRLVAQFESPLVRRDPGAEAGDVAFAGRRGDGLRVLARANLVLFMRSADRERVPIGDAASQLDAELTSKPEPAAVGEARRAAARPAIVQARLGVRRPLRRGDVVPISVRAEDPRREPLVYKAFTASGELRLEDAEPVYRHTTSGPADVEVFAVAPGRGAARHEIHGEP